MCTAWARAPTAARKAPSKSAGARTVNGRSRRFSARAADSASRAMAASAVASRRIATRESRGRASRRSSKRFPASSTPRWRTGDVATRLRKTGRQPGCHRVSPTHHHDGNSAGGFAYGVQRLSAPGHDDIHAQLDEFSSQSGEPIDLPISESELEDDRLSLDVAEVGRRYGNRGRARARASAQGPYAWNPRRGLCRGSERGGKEQGGCDEMSLMSVDLIAMPSESPTSWFAPTPARSSLLFGDPS